MYNSYKHRTSFDVLVGKTIKSVKGLQNGSEEVRFELDNGDTLVMLYEQDCCASCSIDDFTGDVDDIIETPIVVAEERKSDGSGAVGPNGYKEDSATWTFYTIRTHKGTVDIKWFGSSNGYYSESTTLYLVPGKTRVFSIKHEDDSNIRGIEGADAGEAAAKYAAKELTDACEDNTFAAIVVVDGCKKFFVEAWPGGASAKEIYFNSRPEAL
jgi:hypothetical protein